MSCVTSKTSVALQGDRKGVATLQSFNPDRTIDLKACETGDLRCMCFNIDGTLLATVSDIGTIFRVFDSSQNSVGKKLHEFRRGGDSADVYSMCFSPKSNYLLVNSDKFSIHLFSLANTKHNSKSILSAASWGYFDSSVRSAATVPKDTAPNCFCKVAFTSENEFIVVTEEKEYHKYKITESDTQLEISFMGYKQLEKSISKEND